jgi:hypothetical protein
MHTCCLNQVLSSDGPVSLIIPGQRALRRLALLSVLLTERRTTKHLLHTRMWYLQPSYYATPITNISQSDDEAYSVCKGGPPDDWDEALSLNVCGHLIH